MGPLAPRASRVRRRGVVSVALLALITLGLGRPPPADSDTQPALCGTAVGASPHITKVLWIMMENTSYGGGSTQIPGSPSASYIDGTLLPQCGSTSNYHAVTHPSYPNYLAATSGDTQGLSKDTLGYFAAPSVFSQVDPSWRAYQEFMQQPCHHYGLTGDSTTHQYYVGKHNPAASYSALPVGAPTAGDCTSNDVPMGSTSAGSLIGDVQSGTLPSFGMITPGLCDDMHGLPSGDTACPDTIAAGDRWLATWIPLLTAGPDYAGGNLLIDIVWDEGRGATVPTGGDCMASASTDCIVPNIVISPYTPHTVTATNYSHYSLLRTTEQLLGVSYLGHAADPGTNDMCADFGLCATQPRPPTASFTVACTQLSCSTDGSGSSAPGSTITSYTWDFGDSSSASGPTATHVYAQAGSYLISLTVANEAGLTGSTTRSVNVSSSGVPISFRASASTKGYATSETLTVPAAVRSGDGMLLVATGGHGASLTGPGGWTLVSNVNNSSITTTLWSRVATAADAGQQVTVGFGDIHKGSVQLLAYSGTSTAAPVATVARTATSGSTSSPTTPTVTVAADSSWLVSYWAAKSTAITSMTPPGGELVRSTAYGTGGGRITSVASDKGSAVPAGTAGGLTATTNQPETAGTNWSIVLAAA